MKEVGRKFVYWHIIIGGIIICLVQCPVGHLINIAPPQFLQFSIVCNQLTVFVPNMKYLFPRALPCKISLNCDTDITLISGKSPKTRSNCPFFNFFSISLRCDWLYFCIFSSCLRMNSSLSSICRNLLISVTLVAHTNKAVRVQNTIHNT